MTALVQLRALHKAYGPHPALVDINLRLDRRELVGVVGPDGAGKTTLLRALAGLLEIDAEEATVLGYDLRADVTEFKANVGYVAQSFSLQRDLSVIENLRFTARLHRLPAAEFSLRADELLQRTALTPFADRPAGALSGGMKQKLAIANALLVRPSLLLLDEPTAGVDVVARAEIWAMLAASRASTLILMSTSYLEETAACDRLLYLDGGHLIAHGAPQELQHSVAIELYRVWGDQPRRIAEAAKSLPYVSSTRAGGGYARIEVARSMSPGKDEMIADLSRIPGTDVRLVEEVQTDMESTLLALSRRTHPH